MRSNPSKVALKPLDQFSNRTDMIWIPCVGGQSGTKTITNIAKGPTTRITFSATHTGMAGQWVYISGVTGMTQINGLFAKILYTESQAVVIDLDSTTFTSWASSGTVNFDVLYDRCGNIPPQLIQGTTTSIWTNIGQGITPDGSGTNSLHIPTISNLGEKLSSAKRAVIGCTIKIGASPSTDEQIVSFGANTASASHLGTLNLLLQTSGQVQLTSRGACSATGTNTFAASTALGTSAFRRTTALIDYEEMIQYMYMDQVARSNSAISATNYIGPPTLGLGMAFGARFDAALTLSAKLGAGASGAIARDVMLWVPDNAMTAAEVHAAIRAYHKLGEWPAGY